MACPFFRPTERLDESAWLKPPRAPLGEPCRGICTAEGSGFEPGIPALREMCNFGYARGRCARFPAAAECDAVRFSVSSDRESRVNLIFILEKDYAPLRHGAVEYDVRGGRFLTEIEDGSLRAQAQRFLDSYLKRRIKD